MDGQVESIREERAQHCEHLVLGCGAFDSSFDVESFRVDPVWTADELLDGPVSEPDHTSQPHIDPDVAAGLCLAAAALLAGRVRFD